MTVLNTEPKVVGKEQDSEETERECVRDVAENERRHGQ
jgi:hypothetical protein